MEHWDQSLPGVTGRHVVIGLGTLYAGLAGVWAATQSSGRSLATILIVTAFISGPGLILVLGGLRLPRANIDPQFYGTTARWCLFGITAMVGILTFYHIQPDVHLHNVTRHMLIFTAFSSLAGFAVGVYDARAKSTRQKLHQQNRELELMRTKLQESNQRLEQFAYAASHDMKEPLRMVSSYLQLIENRYADELDQDGREFIEFAVDGAERMKEMIDGLLDYSRVERQGEPLEAVDLNRVLADAQKNLEMQFAECDADVEIEQLPRVEGDASQLQQLFQNLLSNGVEYSGEEPPQIEVYAERDGDHWIISVADDGVGIDPDAQERVFDIFHREHSTEEHPGTGIGLALCERIVERHGGEIWVDSDPGCGSTFSFTLPRVTLHDD